MNGQPRNIRRDFPAISPLSQKGVGFLCRRDIKVLGEVPGLTRGGPGSLYHPYQSISPKVGVSRFVSGMAIAEAWRQREERVGSPPAATPDIAAKVGLTTNQVSVIHPGESTLTLYRAIYGAKVKSIIEVIFLQLSLALEVNIMNDEQFLVDVGSLE